jgi:hypothetical protein
MNAAVMLLKSVVVVVVVAEDSMDSDAERPTRHRFPDAEPPEDAATCLSREGRVSFRFVSHTSQEEAPRGSPKRKPRGSQEEAKRKPRGSQEEANRKQRIKR